MCLVIKSSKLLRIIRALNASPPPPPPPPRLWPEVSVTSNWNVWHDPGLCRSFVLLGAAGLLQQEEEPRRFHCTTRLHHRVAIWVSPPRSTGSISSSNQFVETSTIEASSLKTWLEKLQHERPLKRPADSGSAASEPSDTTDRPMMVRLSGAVENVSSSQNRLGSCSDPLTDPGLKTLLNLRVLLNKESKISRIKESFLLLKLWSDDGS